MWWWGSRLFFMRCMPRHLIHDRCFYEWCRPESHSQTAPLVETTIVYQVTWHASHEEQAAAPPPHGVGRASRCLSRRDPDAQAHVKIRIHTHRSTAQGWGPTVPLVTRIVYRVMNRWNHVYLGIRKLARHHVVVGQPLVLHEMHATSLDTRSLFL